ncbi:MAG TPA: hypothetical protein VHO29_00215, partial [Marmoricola sp.]|nr:hypothetical protein [Marmoricola sp.]
MGLGHARGVALLLFTLVAALLGLALDTSATAAARRAPSVVVRQVDAETVVVSGRTSTASPTVRIDRRTNSRWTPVKRARAHHHRYASRLRVAPGTTETFRVRSDQRGRRFVVRMPALAPPVTPPAPEPPAPPAAPEPPAPPA